MRLLIFLSLVVCSTAKYNRTDMAKVISMLDSWFTYPTTESPNIIYTATKFNLKPTINLKPTFNDGAQPCTTDNNQAGFCVNPTKCDQVPEKDDPTNFTPRLAACHYLTPCCPTNKIIKNPISIAPQTTIGCGWSNPNANVFKGQDKPFCNGCSDFGDFPFMVALLKPSQSTKWSDRYIGGGGLIHASVVVTAAHKLNGLTAYQLRCRAGEFDTRTTNEILPHQDRDVRKIVIHENFGRVFTRYDIALLILKKPFNLANAPHIGVACLDTKIPPPGTNCFSMGWGQDFNDRNKYAVLLKKISLPLVDRAQCQRDLQRRLGPKYFLHSSMICAGGEEGKDTCLGDGGSPLVCSLEVDGDSTRYAIYGLVAYGIGCGLKDVPAVYVNMPYFYSWIEDTLADEGYDNSFCTISK